MGLMTREEFMTATVARLIDEGLDLQAARLHAICIVSSHWPLTELTDREWAADEAENGVFS